MMRINRIFILISFLFLLMVFVGFAAENVEFKASINADKIGIDDVLIYTLTFKGVENPAEPPLSDLEDFKVVQTSRSTEFRFVNGVSSHYTNLVYYLMPLKTGTLTIPPAIYKYKGKHFETEPFKVEVVKGSVAPRKPQPPRRRFPSIFDDEDDFFRSPFRRTQPQEIDVKLKAEVSKQKAVKGEPITYRILLFTRNRIQSVNMVSNQSFPGFWQEWFPVSSSIGGENRNVDGKIYQVFEIRKAVLFPNQTGSVTIPSLKFEMALVVDAFSLFSDARRIVRSTPEITIEVSDLPQEALGLPVGDFTFNIKADKKEVDINDILTLRLNIRARKGNIKTLEIPEFITTDYYKIYPSKISRDTNFNQNSLSGVVKAEVPVSFKKVGLISFPALEFKYFNPDASIIVTLKSSPFSIHVKGVKEKQETALTIPQTEIIKKGEDIDFIKKGNIYDQEQYYYKTSIFKILLVVFFLLNLFFLLKAFVFDRFISQSTLLKKKKRLNNTLNRLKKVREYSEISPILEEYLKEKAGLGLSEINNHSIEELFSKYRVNDSDIKIFIQLKSESELSRFSPQKAASGKGEGKKLRNDLKQLIEILKRIDSRVK